MTELQKIYSPEKFRIQGHQIIDLMSDYLLSTEKDASKTISWVEPESQYTYWKKNFEEIGLDDPIALFKNVLERSINVHHKKYMGHQIAVVPPVMGLSAMMISILNNGMGVYEMGMTGNSMERVVIENIIEKIGFTKNASGFVVTGGTVGNLTAILAARAAVSDIWNKGNGDQKFAILVSAESHYSIDRAVRILGMGEDSVFKIPVNNNFQINSESLEEVYQKAMGENRKVICLIGCSCTTATGSYDDLTFLGNFCQDKKIWFHVDGAHGGPVIYSEKYKSLVKGIEMADSVIIDFHKMMMTPSLSTALIFKRNSQSFQTFSQHAEYLWRDEDHHDWYNSGMRTLECTKSMSILNVYTLFKMYGEKIFEENVNVLFGLAKSFAELLEKSGDFELPILPQSNIVCFRYIPQGFNNNKLNIFIRKELVKDGQFYIVQATLNNTIYLRVSLMNPLTGVEELEQLITLIKKIAINYEE